MSEYDPFGKSSKEPGSKLDFGKSPVYQGLLDYFPRACKAVAEVSAFGASKYSWKGWETVPDGINRYGNALIRHITDEAIDGSYAPDSKQLHAAHTAWNSMARLELLLKEKEGKQNVNISLGSVSGDGGQQELFAAQQIQQTVAENCRSRNRGELYGAGSLCHSQRFTDACSVFTNYTPAHNASSQICWGDLNNIQSDWITQQALEEAHALHKD